MADRRLCQVLSHASHDGVYSVGLWCGHRFQVTDPDAWPFGTVQPCPHCDPTLPDHDPPECVLCGTPCTCDALDGGEQ